MKVAVEEPKDRIFEIKVKKGMPGVEGPLGLERDFFSQISLGPSFAVLNARPPWRRGADEKCAVELRFNKRVDVLREKPRVKLDPDVPGLVVSWTGQGVRLYGAFESPDRHFVATVEDDVVSSDGEVVPAGARFSFVMPKRSPTISFVHEQGVLSPKGNLEVELRTCAVRNLRLSATKIYPNNLAAHLRGDSWYRPDRIGRELFSVVKPLKVGANAVSINVVNLKDWIEEPLGLYYLDASNEDGG